MAENTAEFIVRGIDSEVDADRIESELGQREEIVGAEIDPESGTAAILYDVDLVSEEEVKRTIRDMGIDVE